MNYRFLLPLLLCLAACNHITVGNTDKKHVVAREGDTLYGVSLRAGVTIYDLIRDNKLQPPYGIVAGQVFYYQQDAEKTASPLLTKAIPIAKPDGELAGVNKKKTTEKKDSFFTSFFENYKKSVADHDAAVEHKPVSAANQRLAKTIASNNKFDVNFIWPVYGSVSRGFGIDKSGFYNEGINIRSYKGRNVVATYDGQIIYADNGLRGYGNLVIIQHEGGYVTSYAHMDSVSIKVGDLVKQGGEIGVVGTTGDVTTAQLHFSIRKDRRAIDPRNLLPHYITMIK
jgi:murein DD-endopeptidase MepM/ murein hydrolase activator NlpD